MPALIAFIQDNPPSRLHDSGVEFPPLPSFPTRSSSSFIVEQIDFGCKVLASAQPSHIFPCYPSNSRVLIVTDAATDLHLTVPPESLSHTEPLPKDIGNDKGKGVWISVTRKNGSKRDVTVGKGINNVIIEETIKGSDNMFLAVGFNGQNEG
ncbi:unnamed protein product [Dovyalis caffra]|uniref:Uncharacterized protein n=1 Tax=Dovyalis caffra TaxID=77055 RepID=A0AAV1RFS4_9ROSI|nr:unnamed protein product [Dovyalis caffra]